MFKKVKLYKNLSTISYKVSDGLQNLGFTLRVKVKDAIDKAIHDKQVSNQQAIQNAQLGVNRAEERVRDAVKFVANVSEQGKKDLAKMKAEARKLGVQV